MAILGSFFLLFATIPRFAGGNPPSCVGNLCGPTSQKTHWPEAEYAEQISLRNAIGERAFEMFPNLYRFAYWMMGNVLGNPYVQTGLKVAEEASYGTPAGADEAIFRGLRGVPEYLSRFEGAAGVGAALGAIRSAKGGLGGRTISLYDLPAPVAAREATYIPSPNELPVVTAARARRAMATRAAELERMAIVPSRGEIVPVTHRIIREGGEEFIEFQARRAHLPGMTVTHGSNRTPLAFATVDPMGRVIVVEGRHRAVATAAGDVTVPVALGGIPARPGWLRYRYTPYAHPVVQNYVPYSPEMGMMTPVVPMELVLRNAALIRAARSAAVP